MQRSDRGTVLIISQNEQGRPDKIHVKKWNIRCNRESGQYNYQLHVLFPEILGLIVTKRKIS